MQEGSSFLPPNRSTLPASASGYGGKLLLGYKGWFGGFFCLPDAILAPSELNPRGAVAPGWQKLAVKS